MQGAGAQFFFTGPGFLPDENGTNLDAPQGGKASPNLAAITVVKDCAECPEMVVIPAGTFVMGSVKSANEQPMHSVNLRNFLMGKTEVTQEQWESVMGNNPSQIKGRAFPVEQVSWNDAQQFIVKLNQKTGRRYRLPSEAEWEYAARAGTTTEWSFGDDESNLPDYAWYSGNSGGKTQVVGRKKPNPFGLFDMHGNVWEWTQDCYQHNYSGAPMDGTAKPDCPFKSPVLRGGSWYNESTSLRSAFRYGNIQQYRYNNVGFRVASDF